MDGEIEDGCKNSFKECLQQSNLDWSFTKNVKYCFWKEIYDSHTT